MGKQLRHYQQEAKSALIQSVEGGDRGLLVMASGLGKTIVAASFTEWFLGNEGRALFLTHQTSITRQAKQAFDE